VTGGIWDAPRAERKEPTITDLFGRLASDSGTLLRQQVELATEEMGEKVRIAGRWLAVMAAGTVLGVAGVMCLVVAAIFGLGTAMPLWAAALVAGGVLGVVCAASGAVAYRALLRLDLTPRRTLRTLREDRLWVQEQFR
jgi:hypothetical protein